MNMTERFPMTVKPLREGVYEIIRGNSSDDLHFFSCWRDGAWRSVTVDEIDRAAEMRMLWLNAHHSDNLGWRGLTTPQGE